MTPQTAEQINGPQVGQVDCRADHSSRISDLEQKVSHLRIERDRAMKENVILKLRLEAIRELVQGDKPKIERQPIPIAPTKPQP